MQKLNTLWQVVSLASDLKGITRHTQTYYFSTIGPITFYLQAEHAEVRVMRWALPKVEVTATLQAAFGWRIATDQDAAGVYVVAKRKALLGGMSSAVFTVIVPDDAYLVLKLDDGRVMLEHINGTLQVPPTSAESVYHLLPSRV
jgi:hypothetical protein